MGEASETVATYLENPFSPLPGFNKTLFLVRDVVH